MAQLAHVWRFVVRTLAIFLAGIALTMTAVVFAQSPSAPSSVLPPQLQVTIAALYAQCAVDRDVKEIRIQQLEARIVELAKELDGLKQSAKTDVKKGR